MTFLPMVERELRVASRKRSTFWVRVGAALVALVICGAFLLLSLAGGVGMGPAALGKTLFAVLSWICLAGALSVGLFFTADCLGEEKRAGTLGLLFLTDLRGYDVVLGKLLATSLRGAYGLLAVFPVLAVPLLMGGVTGMQLWKTSLALINALLLSLAAGLLVSSIGRDGQKTLAGTLLLLLLWVAVGPMADGYWANHQGVSFEAVLSLSSPGYLFVEAGSWGRTNFWSALMVNQIMVWTVLGLSCLILPRAWQEKSVQSGTFRKRWRGWFRSGGSQRRQKARRRLLEANPVRWLVSRERWQAVVLWFIALLCTGALIKALASDFPQEIWMLGSYAGGLISLGLYLGVASQVGRFMVEVRQGGLLEMLLVTPVTMRQVVQGQCQALLRIYGLPLALLLAVVCSYAYLAQRQNWRVVTQTASATVKATNAASASNAVAGTPVGIPSPSSSQRSTEVMVSLAVGLMSLVTIVGNLVALTWFGMWMGLTSRNGSLSALKTILFVQVIPWFAATILSGLAVPLLFFGGGGAISRPWIQWYPVILSGSMTGLYLVKNAGLFWWARGRLYHSFRMQLSEGRSGPWRSGLK